MNFLLLSELEFVHGVAGEESGMDWFADGFCDQFIVTVPVVISARGVRWLVSVCLKVPGKISLLSVDHILMHGLVGR